MPSVFKMIFNQSTQAIFIVLSFCRIRLPARTLNFQLHFLQKCEKEPEMGLNLFTQVSVQQHETKQRNFAKKIKVNGGEIQFQGTFWCPFVRACTYSTVNNQIGERCPVAQT